MGRVGSIVTTGRGIAGKGRKKSLKPSAAKLAKRSNVRATAKSIRSTAGGAAARAYRAGAGVGAGAREAGRSSARTPVRTMRTSAVSARRGPGSLKKGPRSPLGRGSARGR